MPTTEARGQVVNRLKSVAGHMRGVIRMVEEDAYCMDVIKQLQAVQAAIGRVNALLLADHLETCVTTAIRGDEPGERERVIHEVLRLFEHGAATSTPITGPASLLNTSSAMGATGKMGATDTTITASNGQDASHAHQH